MLMQEVASSLRLHLVELRTEVDVDSSLLFPSINLRLAAMVIVELL